MPEGLGTGIGEALHAVAQNLREREKIRLTQREKAANDLTTQMLAISDNLSKVHPNSPEAQKLKTSLRQTIEQHNNLFDRHETPLLMQRVRNLFPHKPEQPVVSARHINPDAFMGTVAPYQPKLEDAGGYSYQGKNYQRRYDPVTRQYTTEEVPGPTDLDIAADKRATTLAQIKGLLGEEKYGQLAPTLEALTAGVPYQLLDNKGNEHKPLAFEYHPQTGGLSAIKDPNNGATYDASNIATAPPDIKARWDAINVQQEGQLKLKREEEDRRNREAEERQNRSFAAALTRQQQAFQNALDRNDYAAARKTVTEADNHYQDAVDRMNKMDLAEKSANEGNGQADVSLLFNHIGMTLSAQSGARITEAEIDRAIKTRSVPEGLLALWDKVSQGTFLSPEQRHQMVGLAHEGVNILQQRKDRVSKEYADALGMNKPNTATPGDLKDKAAPKPGAKVFNAAKWKSANPSGDVEAAKAEAKKQGYLVR